MEVVAEAEEVWDGGELGEEETQIFAVVCDGGDGSVGTGTSDRTFSSFVGATCGIFGSLQNDERQVG